MVWYVIITDCDIGGVTNICKHQKPSGIKHIKCTVLCKFVYSFMFITPISQSVMTKKKFPYFIFLFMLCMSPICFFAMKDFIHNLT